MHRLRLCLALLLACWCAEAAQGQSYGRWGVPGTFAQFIGYGNGAGHHAPRVRTPDCQPPQVQRVTYQPCNSAPPQPSYVSGCNNGQCSARMAPQQYAPTTPQAFTHPQAMPWGVQ